MFIEVTTQGDQEILIHVDQITSVIPLTKKIGSMITLTSTAEGGEAEVFEVKNTYEAIRETLHYAYILKVVPRQAERRITAAEIMEQAPYPTRDPLQGK